MDTVFIKWTILYDERHNARITGIVCETTNKKKAEIYLFFNIFAILICAFKYGGKLKTMTEFPKMDNKTTYFELIFKDKDDLLGFVNTVTRESK